MYDKIALWMEREAAGNDFSAVPGYLENVEERRDIVTDVTRYYGSLGPLQVRIHPHGLSVIGSWPKFLLSDNVGTLARNDAARVVEAISDGLHVDMSNADVTGLEFGSTYLMKREPQAYFHKLGEMPRMKRMEFDALYYQGRGKKKPFTANFYDKAREVEARGDIVPYGLNGSNLLRYEIRLRGKIASRMKCPFVKASTLAEMPFYRKMIELYKETYFSIHKNQEYKTDNMSQIKTVSDAFNLFVARLINQGGNTQITAFLDELKGAAIFRDKKYYTRLKKRLMEAAEAGGVTVSDELIAELDGEIKNATAYY